jgi:hypothetical protein
MAWNGPINNDWSKVDLNAAPWNNDICTLTNDECVECKNALIPFQEQFGGDLNSVVSGYDNSTNWEKPINGVTYNCLQSYNQAINTQGINAQGIVPEPQPEAPQDPPTGDNPPTGV